MPDPFRFYTLRAEFSLLLPLPFFTFLHLVLFSVLFLLFTSSSSVMTHFSHEDEASRRVLVICFLSLATHLCSDHLLCSPFVSLSFLFFQANVV